MAWTTPRTWTTSELVTAAMMNTHVRDNLNFLAGWGTGHNADSRTFTNTGLLDLDALTGGAGTMAAVTATVTTDTAAVVFVNAFTANSTLGATVQIAYKVSGATTIAGQQVLQHESGAASDLEEMTAMRIEEALNAGSNTFELQASTSAGTGDIRRPRLVVVPLA